MVCLGGLLLEHQHSACRPNLELIGETPHCPGLIPYRSSKLILWHLMRNKRLIHMWCRQLLLSSQTPSLKEMWGHHFGSYVFQLV